MNRKIRTMATSFRPERALAVALAAAALLVTAAPALAVDNSPDPGVRCVAKVGVGEYEFYLPGERATDKDGNKWVCGPDGKWFRDYSALRVFRYSVTQVPARVTLAL
jgi:hypothetical protein